MSATAGAARARRLSVGSSSPRAAGDAPLDASTLLSPRTSLRAESPRARTADALGARRLSSSSSSRTGADVLLDELQALAATRAGVDDRLDEPLVPPYVATVHASVVAAAVRTHAATYERQLASGRDLVRALLDEPAVTNVPGGATLRARLVDDVRVACARGETRLRVLFTEYARSATADILFDSVRYSVSSQYLGRDEHAVPTQSAGLARRAVGALVHDTARAREVLVTSVRALLGTYDVFFDDDAVPARVNASSVAVLVIDWTEHMHRVCAVAV